MIGYLEGEIKYVTKGKVVLFVNGIGFNISIPGSIILSEKDKASLYIHTHLRDDDLSLFGFSNPEDLELFELLISVSGVGPKIGLAIFSVADSENIKEAIKTSNLNFFNSISGVGKKTAQKIILDLKSKIDRGEVIFQNLEGNSELLDSLISLGFQKKEILSIISRVDISEPLPSQIKNSLRLLNK